MGEAQLGGCCSCCLSLEVLVGGCSPPPPPMQQLLPGVWNYVTPDVQPPRRRTSKRLHYHKS